MSKFNVGDRVRAKNPNWELHFDCGNDFGILTHTDVGIVKGQSHYGDDFIEVAYCDGWVCEDFTEDELELVEAYDPKTAFLTELKGLLEKYDAKISAYPSGWDGETDICFTVGDIDISYSDDNPIFKDKNFSEITPDNIMDYDKE